MALAGMVYDQIFGLLGYLVPFLGLLTVIVFIHEFGHFQVARWCGVTVETFSIGFGREIFGWHDKYNTRWRLAWIPLGGYVKFKGDANAASMPGGEHTSKDPGDFHNKKLWQRALIVVAGPVANFLLAIAIFTTLYMSVGQVHDDAKVDKVLPGSAAESSGIQSGDIITKIDGTEITRFAELQKIVTHSAGVELNVSIDRGGEALNVVLIPQKVEVDDGLGGKMSLGRMGITHSPTEGRAVIRLSLPAAIMAGANETWSVTTGTLNYLKRMVTGRESTQSLSGPIGIARISGAVAAISFSAFAELAAILSISIGLLNLFPIPMLDGGHLLYYGLEAVRGKPLGQNAQIAGFKVGLALVLTLMVVATWNDLSRLNLF